MFLPLDLWTNDPSPVEVRPPLVCGVRGVRCGEDAVVVPRVVGRGVPGIFVSIVYSQSKKLNKNETKNDRKKREMRGLR